MAASRGDSNLVVEGGCRDTHTLRDAEPDSLLALTYDTLKKCGTVSVKGDLEWKNTRLGQRKNIIE